MPYLQLAPWHLGTRFTFVRQPLAQLSLAFQGSKDCNPRSATPSDVRGNRRIIISLADHGEAALAAFSVEWIARYNLATLPGMSLYVMALLRSRFLHRERTSVLGIQLSRFLQYYCIKSKSWRMLCTISWSAFDSCFIIRYRKSRCTKVSRGLFGLYPSIKLIPPLYRPVSFQSDM